jgi:Protein of unknown function (DUF1360)
MPPRPQQTQTPPRFQSPDGAGDATEPRARLAPYGLLTGAYAAAVGAFLWRFRDRLPDAISAGDLALLGVASHKTSRTISKDKVTAPLRAPFTEHEGEGGPGELEESPRGTGVQHTVGELLACPFCLDQWVATGYVAGLVVAPRATRFVASVMATVAISDFLQIGYKASEEQL